jgi:hypothetical protein
LWRIPSDRNKLDLDGPAVEVERLHSFHVQQECQRLIAVFTQSSDRDAMYTALSTLFDRFVAEAMPQWDIVDGKGPVPADGRGMARLPLPLSLAMIQVWVDDLEFGIVAEAKPTSAVDEMVPPGPVNAELKRRLAAAKRRRKAA